MADTRIHGSLAFYWYVSGFIEFCIYGVLAAWLYPIGTGHGVPGRGRPTRFPASRRTDPVPAAVTRR